MPGAGVIATRRRPASASSADRGQAGVASSPTLGIVAGAADRVRAEFIRRSGSKLPCTKTAQPCEADLQDRAAGIAIAAVPLGYDEPYLLPEGGRA